MHRIQGAVADGLVTFDILAPTAASHEDARPHGTNVLIGWFAGANLAPDGLTLSLMPHLCDLDQIAALVAPIVLSESTHRFAGTPYSCQMYQLAPDRAAIHQVLRLAQPLAILDTVMAGEQFDIDEGQRRLLQRWLGEATH